MQTIRLTEGLGKEGTSHCVMAATSIVAGENFSDKPSCVSQCITRALICVNDICKTDEMRERLLGHLPWLIIGTRSDNIEVEVTRAKKFAEYAYKLSVEYYGYGYINGRSPTNYASTAIADAARADAYIALSAPLSYKAAAKAAVIYACDASAHATSAVCLMAYNDFEGTLKKFIDFIEEEIIPVYTTMTVEPGYNIEKLVTTEV